jgi:hypothetical protein
MQSDLYLVAGLVIGALAIPAVVSAFSDGRVPRAGAIMVMVSIGLLVAALSTRPGGYRIDEVPSAFVRVIGRLVN